MRQEKRLQDNLEACRWLYNKFVEFAQDSFLTRNDMNYFLTELKQQEPWLYNYHSKMLQMVSTKINGAQMALVGLKKKGYKVGNLKFVKYNQYRTFTYNQSGYMFNRHGDKNLLQLSKIGCVEIRLHRTIPQNADIKQVTITKSKSGKWYACTICDIGSTIQIPKINFKKCVGIDIGIKNLAYDSQGCVTSNPKNLGKTLNCIAKIQKKMARRQKGSQNRRKSVRWYQRIHERVANRRKNFLHQLSTQYARNYGICFVEKLEKCNMIRNHALARNIADASWGAFVRMLEYKCTVIKVPARNTSIECSRCGNKVPKSLAIRIHRCDKCGLVLDRDHNAAINILQKGLKILNLPQELREVTPVEIPDESLKQENVIGIRPMIVHNNGSIRKFS